MIEVISAPPALSHGTIVITGGGSGIGLATAQTILERHPSARCALLDTHFSAEFEDAIAPVRDQVDCHVANVTAREEIFDIVEGIQDVVGLVTCAGNLGSRPSVDVTHDDLFRVLDVHLWGSLVAAQAVARAWRSAEVGGSVVLVSSVAAGFAWPGRLPYAVAKSGIESMARTLAAEWASAGVRVNAVSPGYVDSPMMADSTIPEGVRPLADAAGLHMLGRVADPREIANAIVFLLSGEASFITGSVLPVDGGFSGTKEVAALAAAGAR